MDNPDPKRKNPELDRISQLPDHLLLKILSDMPLKDAITTSILSKRFQHLWTFLDRLRFICKENASKRKLDRFAAFVDNVLHLSRCTNIKKVLIQVDYYQEYESKISVWLRWAVWRNVEKILLDFHPYMKNAYYSFYVPQPFYRLSQNVCTCSSLVTLYISRCRFQESGVISWKLLRRLTMTSIVLDDRVMEKLLLGCPVLETLELVSFNGFSTLSITNPKVKKLMLFHYWLPHGHHRGDNVLKISAPYIQELEISGRLYDLQCRLVDVSSLVWANINFELSFSDEFDNDDYDICLKVGKDLVQSLAHVKELTLGKWLLQVLSMLGKRQFSYSLSNCKCLTLNSYMSNFEFPAVVSLLDSSPQLETLVINVDTFANFFIRDGREPSYDESEIFLNSQYRVIKSLALHLKNVKIANYQFQCMINEVLLHWQIRSEEHEHPSGNFESADLLTEEELLCNEVYHHRLRVKKLVANKEMFKRLIFEQDMCCKIAEFLLKNGTVLEQLVIVSEREVCPTCSTCCAFEYLSLVAEKLLTVPKSSTSAVIKFVEKHQDSIY